MNVRFDIAIQAEPDCSTAELDFSQAPQVTYPHESGASRKNRFGDRRAFSQVARSSGVLRRMYAKDDLVEFCEERYC